MQKHVRGLFAIATAFLCIGAHSASALDKLRAGKAVDVAWTFTMLDIGNEEGIFAKYGIEVEILTFLGDAKLQQAMAADSADFGLGSGPSMAFAVKGAPVIGVAAFAAAPRNIAVVVLPDGLKTVQDLKGKLVSVSSPGSLTEWLVKRLAFREGWGADGIRTIATGSGAGQMSALRTHATDAMMAAAETGYQLEEKGEGRILTTMGDYAPQFVTHVIFARRDMVRDKPDTVARFLKGFFATIAFMRENKEKTNAIAHRVLNESPTSLSKTYDAQISMLIGDGHFDPAGVEVLKDSFVDMGILTERPPSEQLYTTQFVPVKF